MITALSERGGVNLGELEPNNAIVGLSSAADMCINPESLVTTQIALDKIWMASFRLVIPVRSISSQLLAFLTCLPVVTSLGPPSIIGVNPSSCRYSLSRAKWTLGHFLALPYSAPGQRHTYRVSEAIRYLSRVLLYSVLDIVNLGFSRLVLGVTLFPSASFKYWSTRSGFLFLIFLCRLLMIRMRPSPV